MINCDKCGTIIGECEGNEYNTRFPFGTIPASLQDPIMVTVGNAMKTLTEKHVCGTCNDLFMRVMQDFFRPKS
jgi:hypothetical protein